MSKKRGVVPEPHAGLDLIARIEQGSYNASESASCLIPPCRGEDSGSPHSNRIPWLPWFEPERRMVPPPRVEDKTQGRKLFALAEGRWLEYLPSKSGAYFKNAQKFK